MKLTVKQWSNRGCQKGVKKVVFVVIVKSPPQNSRVMHLLSFSKTDKTRVLDTLVVKLTKPVF